MIHDRLLPHLIFEGKRSKQSSLVLDHEHSGWRIRFDDTQLLTWESLG